MDNIEKVKKELLKKEEIEIQPNTFATEIIDDFRRDFKMNERKPRQEFRKACDKFKKDFHVVLTSLKKGK